MGCVSVLFTPGEREKMGERQCAEFMAAARDCMSRGDWEETRDLARRHLSEHPGDKDAIYVLVRALIGLGDGEGAIEALRDLKLTDNEAGELYRDLGDLLYERRDWERACYYYEKFVRLLPAAHLAEALKRLSADLSLSEEREPEVIREVPQDFQTMTLVDLYVKQGHLMEALEVLESMRMKDPTNEKIVDRIRGVQALMGEEAELGDKKKKVLAELDRWLQNIYKAG